MPITDKKKKITLWRSPRHLFSWSKKLGEYEAETYDEAVEKFSAENPDAKITVIKEYRIDKDDLLYSED